MRLASPGSRNSQALAVLATLASLALLSLPAQAAGEPLEHKAEIAQSRVSKLDLEKGAELYQQNCAACHQANGQGLPGAFPPLAKSDFIAANPDAVLEVTVKGRQGELVVNGAKYNNVMPAMSYLKIGRAHV